MFAVSLRTKSEEFAEEQGSTAPAARDIDSLIAQGGIPDPASDDEALATAAGAGGGGASAHAARAAAAASSGGASAATRAAAGGGGAGGRGASVGGYSNTGGSPALNTGGGPKTRPTSASHQHRQLGQLNRLKKRVNPVRIKPHHLGLARGYTIIQSRTYLFLSINLPIYLSVYLSTYLSIYLSIYLAQLRLPSTPVCSGMTLSTKGETPRPVTW